MSPASWGRKLAIFTGIAEAADIIGQIGRLAHFGELTKAQGAAGVRIGEIWHRHCRFVGVRASAKSASLEQGFGMAGVAEERMTEEEIENFEVSERAARAAWHVVADELERVPANVRQAVYDVCCHDTPTNPTLYNDLRLFLDRMGRVWGESWRHARGTNPRLPRPKPALVAIAAPKRRMVPWDLIAGVLDDYNKTLYPAMTEQHRTHARETFLALIDRRIMRKDNAVRAVG